LTTSGYCSKKGTTALSRSRSASTAKGQNPAPRALRANSPAAKGRNHRFKYVSMVLVLVDVERRLKLPTAVSVHHRSSMHRNGEASFAIHKAS
jgi:hypothetical protein